MIAPSFLNFSSEQLFVNEFPLLDPVLDNMELQGSLNNVDSNGTWEEQSSIYSGSPVHSFTSEDCDMLAVTEDLVSIFPLSDSLTAQILQEDGIDLIDLDNLNWLSLSNSHNPESTNDSTNKDNIATESPSNRKRTNAKSKQTTKSWSKMNSKERLDTAVKLSNIVSCQMPLHQQIDVIKLIDPNAVLSPSSKEFTIKLSHLNDTKLKRICEYLNKHTSCFIDFDTLMSSSSSAATSSSSVKSNSASRAKRRPRAGNNTSCTEELKFRKQKFIRQDRKEKRSGLFQQEKVIRKLYDPNEEDDYVNILE